HPHRAPWPVTLTVTTVPVLVGIPFEVDGEVVKTDATGTARFTQEHNFGKHTLAVKRLTVVTPTQRYRFVRWAGQRDPDQAFRPEVTGLPMRASYTVTAGYAVEYPVTPRFTGTGGGPVAADRIDAVSVRADTGRILPLDPDAPTWLAGLTPVYRNSSLSLKRSAYTLQTVMVDGANVVDVGQQSFRPATRAPVVFGTKFFDLTIRAHDALFKHPIGEQATVTYPNGTTRTITLDAEHTATLTDLPRGVYVVRLLGSGTSLPTQVTLSRNAAAELVVMSRVDLTTMALVGLTLAAGLLAMGRGRRRVRFVVSAAAQPIQRSVRRVRDTRDVTV
ncbi:MAG: hypothetical protein WAL50_07135, partial [Kineosporiaceae bacterium]